jgi:hypothetical protein
MTCVSSCLNEGICSFNDTCTCPMCFIGKRCEINVNVIKFSLTFAMHWDIRQADLDSNFNTPKFIYTTVIALMLLMALINNTACLQTFLLHEIRLTNCGIFQILYCCSGLFAIIGMQLRMLTMLEFDSLTQAYSYRYTACNIIHVLVIIMGDTCTWLSTLLVIEFVLLECVELSIYRTRWFSVISSLIVLLVATGSHFHEIIARRPLVDPKQTGSYTCTFIYPLPLDILDRVFRIIHVIIPCAIHFIASMCILINITQRIIIVRDRHDYFRIFLSECIKRKHCFVPPLFIILSNLPHLILHLKDMCEDARNTSLLRLHVAFNILVYLPPCVTFFIYIYPSNSYMHKFKQTFCGRWLRRLFPKKKKDKVDIWHTNLKAVSHLTLTSSVPSTPQVTGNNIES